MTTAIFDRSTVTLDAVKRFLRLHPTDCSEDAVLRTLLDSAKRAADSYCSNPFVDNDGNELDIPEPVEEWILRRVAARYQFREGGVSSLSVSGVGSTNLEGDLADLFPYWRPFI